MPSYMVDSMRQPFTATGIVDPVMEWEEMPDGKRRPSRDKQARNENTGMPLWGVEVLYIQTAFGRRSTVTANVTVECETEPKPAPMTPIGFTGLQVEVRVNKAGGFIEYWSAESIIDTSKPAQLGQPRGSSGEKAA
jgi:hypothetical protein